MKKEKGGYRLGAGRKTSEEGPRKMHSLRFTDASWNRILQNAKAEGYQTITSFIEAKTAY